MAERGGFEPPIPCGIRAFQARAFDHSATSPVTKGRWTKWSARASVNGNSFAPSPTRPRPFSGRGFAKTHRAAFPFSMLTVDLVSDFACPWCYIGAARLAQALGPRRVEVAVNYHPFLLNPDLPPEGADLRAYLRARYGGDPEEMFANVEAAARETGLPLDFSRVTRFPNTVAAHTLARHAPQQASFATALFEANFVHGRDLGDATVLTELALAHGFAADAVARLLADDSEHARTRQIAAALSARGITGVPFFVFGQRLALSGAQPVEVFRQALAEAGLA